MYQQANFTEVLERLTDGFVVVDKSWHYSYINNKAGEILNCDPKTTIGKHIWTELPERINQLFYKACYKAMETQQYIYLEDFNAIYGHWFENHIYPSSEGISIFFRNISNKKKAEEAIKVSEEKFRTLVHQAPDGIFLCDLDGNYLEANEGAARITGYSIDELKQMNGSDIVPAVELKKSPLKLEEIKRGGPVYVERIIRRKDNILIEVEISAKLMSGDKVIVIMRDISENKKIQEQIIREKELSDSIINSLPGIFYLFDANRNILRWNKNFETVSGYTADEIRQIKPIDFYEGKGRKLVQENFTKTLQEGWAAFEANFVSKKGELIPFFFTGVLVSYEGEPCLLGTGIDISVGKKAEQEKEFERRDKESLINSTEDLIWSVSKDLKLIAANDAFIKSLKNVTDITFQPGDDLMMENVFPSNLLLLWEGLYRKALAGEKFTKEIYIAATESTAASWSEINFHPVYHDKEITGLACYARDITERNKVEKEIKATTEQLRQLTAHLQSIREEERKRIGREIHDELGQQLTAIKMDIAWIDKKIPEDAALIKIKLKNIIGLLDGSHISVRRILNELRTDILETYGLTAALEWQGRQFTTNTGIALTFTCAEADLKVEDPLATCIFRVFQEALTNVTKYAQAQQVNASLNLTGNKIVFSIEDDGKGFDIKLLINRRSFGILGMRERVASVKGKFKLISSPGKGTKILLTIPVKM
ncbi:MAG: PAS domain S-box protein [Chitinophagaceae bacterium]